METEAGPGGEVLLSICVWIVLTQVVSAATKMRRSFKEKELTSVAVFTKTDYDLAQLQGKMFVFLR